MIVSKPKISTLFSIFIFLAIAFGLFIYGVLNVYSSEDRIGWYVLIYTSGPIGIVVLIKILTGLKFVKVGKEKIEVKMPFKFQTTSFDKKDLKAWNHQNIKTYGGLYQEIIWRLKSGKELNLSKQENTEYDKVLNYMKKKFKNLEA